MSENGSKRGCWGHSQKEVMSLVISLRHVKEALKYITGLPLFRRVSIVVDSFIAQNGLFFKKKDISKYLES